MAHAALIGGTGLVWRLLSMDAATLKAREIPAYPNLGVGSGRFQPARRRASPCAS
jgi:hypothetical protein